MSRRYLVLTVIVSLSACVVANPFIRGDGDTGDEDTGDGDGDGDTNGDGGTSGDGDGDTNGDGDGDTSGDGDGDPGCTRRRWTYEFSNDDINHWSSVALDSVWVGPNAPPCNVEVWAATYLEPWDQLLVFSANGNYYRRVSGSWQAPSPIANTFAEIGDIEIDSVTYVPELDSSPSNLTFAVLPKAIIYDIYADGTAIHSETVGLVNEPPPGPPQANSVREWALVMANAEILGMADWWVTWQGFDNGKLYRGNGAFEWQSWPYNASPLFGAQANAPDPATIEAAWGDYDLQLGYFISP